ncbi:selenide, water dikinase SelD [Persicirhabdus sediminis]|uniref:Selenide, water dikinase n=1 Tax=Persicirhabdus sediminis TaxID=454144 RepID=A0A8J7MCJ9_9BACT|nr:selenide, water dikinase SelD [Persicirhabdus sediminis]
MHQLPQHNDDRLLVGSATADDAGVFKIDDQRALVQTLDFFTPIVDDPYLFGKIAAANSLSDVYAMGGRPITAMAIAGMPDDLLDNETIREILRGGAEMVMQAKASLVGGHTIKNPEPIYGLSVTGIVHPDNVLANANAEAGELIILTKPLGTGILSTAIKRGLCDAELELKASEIMIHLNTVGAYLAEKGLVKACTDITGFGLAGHLIEMADASGTTAILDSSVIPAISPEVIEFIEQGCVPGGTKKNLLNAETKISFGEHISESLKLLLADAQTSGGLMLSVPAVHAEEVLAHLHQEATPCAVVIGKMVARAQHSIIVE